MYALPACICMPLHLHDSGREILWGMIPIRQQRLSQGLAHISKSEEQQESMPSSVQGAFEAAPPPPSPPELRPHTLAHMHECPEGMVYLHSTMLGTCCSAACIESVCT